MMQDHKYSTAQQGGVATRDRQRWLVLSVGLLGLSVLSFVTLNGWLIRQAMQETPNRAAFFAGTIDAALDRLTHLPFVLALDPAVVATLESGDATDLNPVLAKVAERARAEFVFVMDRTGRTVASSNFADADSLVGQFYTFRPYFQDALAGGQGRFYAVGATTGRPGYFMAEPVRDGAGTIRGVVVIKVNLTALSQTWADSGAVLMVTNPQGVVIAGSRPALIFGLTEPLSEQDRETLRAQRKFGDRDLNRLDWAPGADSRARLEGVSYIWTRAKVRGEDWTLHLLSDLSDIRRQALLYVAAGVVAILALVIAAAIFRSGQLRRALAASDADRQRLQGEIEERRAAQAKLQATRKELDRQSRLAALGQLSASITHELGQPISAMRNYLAAEEIGAQALPGALAPQLTSLVERMQRIVDQLRSFGRQNDSPGRVFDAADAVQHALGLVRHDAARLDVTLVTDLQQAFVRGGQQKLEQVIVNLLRNAIDAVAGQDLRQVGVSVAAAGDSVDLVVTDTGIGIGDLAIDDLREPFFTSKPSGKGMGLGLAISAQIVSDMGGTMAARNGDKGGAVFALSFPMAEQVNDG